MESPLPPAVSPSRSSSVQPTPLWSGANGPTDRPTVVSWSISCCQSPSPSSNAVAPRCCCPPPSLRRNRRPTDVIVGSALLLKRGDGGHGSSLSSLSLRSFESPLFSPTAICMIHGGLGGEKRRGGVLIAEGSWGGETLRSKLRFWPKRRPSYFAY